MASKRVLLVDDSHNSRVVITALLALYLVDVVIAHNGQEALGLAAQYQPDSVLLDIAMSTMDGYEVASKLRSELGFRGKIIAVSGYSPDCALQSAFGVDAYLLKPIRLDALLAML